MVSFNTYPQVGKRRKKVKKSKRKIVYALLVMFFFLVVFIGFSKFGILFSDNGKDIVTVSTANKTFDANNYVASVAALNKKNEVEETTTETTTVTTTKAKITTTTTTTSTTSGLTFEGKSVQEVGAILNKTFKGVLTNKGEVFARLCMEKGMDPYLLAAISAEESAVGTSNLATTKFNIGGFKCSYGWCSYSSIDEGMTSFVNVIYNKYFLQGLTTAETMNSKYAESTTWAAKINNWYARIKNK